MVDWLKTFNPTTIKLKQSSFNQQQARNKSKLTKNELTEWIMTLMNELAAKARKNVREWNKLEWNKSLIEWGWKAWMNDLLIN